jgi:hypothetical protein
MLFRREICDEVSCQRVGFEIIYFLNREILRRVESLRGAKAEALSGDVEGPRDVSSVETLEGGVVLPDDRVARMDR